jgi:hypothetical protein
MLAEPPITIAATSWIECPKVMVSGEVYWMTSMYRNPLTPPMSDAIVNASTL